MMRLGIAISIAACIATAGCAPSERTIQCNQIDRDVKIIGPLGVPFGKIITVSGSVVEASEIGRSKDGGTFLRITEVDGKPLAEPETLRWQMTWGVKEPTDWGWSQPHVRAIGYQSAAYRGVPDGLFDFVPSYTSRGWGFVPWFEVVKVVSH